MNNRIRIWIAIIGGAVVTGSGVFWIAQNDIDHRAFILGFLTCFIAGTVLWLLSYRKIVVRHTIEGGSPTRLIFTILVVLICGLVGGYAALSFKSSFEADAHIEELALKRSKALLEAERRSGQAEVMGRLLASVEAEIEKSPTRALSEMSINKIAALAFSLPPYHLLSEDTLSSLPVSPERGQLLLFLTAMNIDTNSMRNIFYRTSFEGAELNGANLRGAFLRNIDLQRASLRNADMQSADLTTADLRGADMWGVMLNYAICTSADFSRTDLRWAEINHARLADAKFSSAQMNSAKVRQSDLRFAAIEWAILDDVFFNNSDLSHASFLGSTMQRAHLNDVVAEESSFRRADMYGADFSSALMTKANFNGTDIDHAILTRVIFDSTLVSDENWLSNLEQNSVYIDKMTRDDYIQITDKSKEGQYLIVRRNQ